MRFLSGRLIVAAGVVLALAGLLVFSLASPSTTVGQETDVSPPASFPDAQGIDISVDDTTPAVGQQVVLSVEVVDRDGDPVVGADCTFDIVSQPGSDASVVAGPVTTGAGGIASTILNVGSTAGTIQVEAECGDSSARVSVVAGATQPGGGSALPPGSLPNTGSGSYLETAGSARVLLVAVLVALGLTLAGGGAIWTRHGRRVRGE